MGFLFTFSFTLYELSLPRCTSDSHHNWLFGETKRASAAIHLGTAREKVNANRGNFALQIALIRKRHQHLCELH